MNIAHDLKMKELRSESKEAREKAEMEHKMKVITCLIEKSFELVITGGKGGARTQERKTSGSREIGANQERRSTED